MVSVNDACDGNPVGNEGRIGKVEYNTEKKISFETGRFFALGHFRFPYVEEGCLDTKQKENSEGCNSKNKFNFRVRVQ